MIWVVMGVIGVIVVIIVSAPMILVWLAQRKTGNIQRTKRHFLWAIDWPVCLYFLYCQWMVRRVINLQAIHMEILLKIGCAILVLTEFSVNVFLGHYVIASIIADREEFRLLMSCLLLCFYPQRCPNVKFQNVLGLHEILLEIFMYYATKTAVTANKYE